LTAGLRLAGPWPTRTGVREALRSLRGYDLGIRAKASYGPDDERGLRRAVVARWRGGAFRPLEKPAAEPLDADSTELDGPGDGDPSPDAPVAEDPQAPAGADDAGSETASGRTEDAPPPDAEPPPPTAFTASHRRPPAGAESP
ncbi:MAG: hypothetical protein AAFX50_12540, partial [Acidobacteriota bacterium]